MLPIFNMSFFIRLSYVRNDYPHDRGGPTIPGNGYDKDEIEVNVAANAGRGGVVTPQLTT